MDAKADSPQTLADDYFQKRSPADSDPTTDQEALPWSARRASLPERQSSSVVIQRPPRQWFRRRISSTRATPRRSSLVLQRTTTGRSWWKFTLRDWDDDEEEDWWFASTAIPLLAATLGPLANVLSIAALVTYWRICLVPGVDEAGAAQCLWDGTTPLQPQLSGVALRDPHWCFNLNVVSLVAGFVGNFFLLCNFTNRIRYIISLPVSILMWYIATSILIGITASMEIYVPPTRPQQTYSEGFWYAVIAACMYLICAMLLMINMLGYFLGHYPQHFTLTDSQRTLILQSMMFFVWLAAGGAIFWKVETEFGTGDMNWSYVNALYFSDVTILTVGFGDLYPTSNVGRGLVLPYSVGGIIMLGLMVSSITKFASEIGHDKVIRRHVETIRSRTIGRTVTSSLELEHRRTLQEGERPVISPPFEMPPGPRTTTINIADNAEHVKAQNRSGTGLLQLRHTVSMSIQPLRARTPKLILLREEKDRFDEMRRIQHETRAFKHWYELVMSLLAFGLLWCGGAVVFWQCEKETQGMTYFTALYFCYVSLLTIGYGDLAPKSSPGRPFFVFWSLIAVPTITILISSLGETVIHKFKNGVSGIADFTVLPKHGVWRDIVERQPWLLTWLQNRKARKDLHKREEEGLPIGPDPEIIMQTPTIDELAKEEPSNNDLAKRLPEAIRRIVNDIKTHPNVRYSYEEWVEFTRLIRFSAKSEEDRETDENEDGLIEWDWIGEDSPMMSEGGEAEFLLDRLCESMRRYIKQASSWEPGPANSNARKKPPSERRAGSEESIVRRRLSDTNSPSPNDREDVGPHGEKP